MNDHNLIPNTERSPEELREMGRKGGIKSGESRRKTRELRKMAKLWLEVFNELESKDKARAKQVYKELSRLLP
ncbi:hypothetical protein [Faecalicatena contorta]|uniref:hypothetical protein n=1 Tax=Faecalicatena contorta TaxID=39482 RepID=UPI001F19286C|nr:hypothetical protein [Faecalicatena contorta]MCF2684141.1 hypothetical protein [Faecalicatena contorta]